MQGNSESVSIYCQDGYQLGGCFYLHAGEFSQKLPILICPATGILQKFYQHFACWLAAQGFDVLTFDFRGVENLYMESLKTPKPVFKIGGCWIFLLQLTMYWRKRNKHK